jgi:phosphoribosylanthranilate isomerase
MKIQTGKAVRIKICGMTNSEDALCAAELGADAIGFVFAPSPRQISPEKARDIIVALPPLVQTVGVFVDEDPEKVGSIAAFCHLDLLQFHGKESAAYCRRFGRRVIKAVRVRNKSGLEDCSQYSGVVDALLLDTHVAASGQFGGTGLSFEWNVALEAKKYGRIILAGGLNPDNVAAAISAAKPYAVDASSGLEQKPGVKDHEKMARFVQTVRVTVHGAVE